MKRFLLPLLAVGLMLGCNATSSTAPPLPSAHASSTVSGTASASSDGASGMTDIPNDSVQGNEQGSMQDTAQEVKPTKPPLPFLNTLYYDRTLFYAGIGGAGEYEVEGDLVAGIIPHHLLASDMIAGFFVMAAKQPAYDGIVIVSPSHFPENCDSMVVTARAGWNTPFGTVQPYTALVDRLLADGVIDAENNPTAVELDHGAAGLVPFVKHYFPDTPLAVCLVQGKLPRDRLTAIWDTIEEQRQQANLLVISSADFSHYLMPKEAAERDAQTMEAIEAGQTERIFFFGDENVDSPQSVNTFLKVAEQAQAQVKRLDHGSSDRKLPHSIDSPIYYEGTTTYMVYAASRSAG